MSGSIQHSGYIIHKWVISVCIMYCALCVNSANGQAYINSPYSRYALGDIQYTSFARNLGMGGIGIGVSTPFNLNYNNPASYAGLTLTTFEGGVRGNVTWLNTSDNLDVKSNSATFAYFAYGFPVKANKWGVAFGLVPYSNVGYNISSAVKDEDAGIITSSYKGNGGVDKFFIGTGFNVAKGLRVGANVSYLFGTIDQVRTVAFPDNVNYFNTRVTGATSLGDFHFDFGLQYNKDSLKVSPSDSMLMARRKIASLTKEIENLKASVIRYQKLLANGMNATELNTAIPLMNDSIAELNKQLEEQTVLKNNIVTKKAKGDWALNIGATVALASDINATRSTLTETYISNLGFVIVKDTVQQAVDEKGVVTLPLSLGFGATMRKGTRWIFGFDVSAQDWTSYSSFGASDSLTNSLRFAGGLQYTPNDRSLRSYWKVIQYRLGFHYNQTYLNLRSTDINEYGISIGFGLPMKRTLSTIQMSFELGKMGTMINDLVEVNYFRVNLGLTLNDLWFVKPKID